MKRSEKSSVDNVQANELKRLKKIEKAYERLQMEHDILKKHPVLFRSKKEIVEFIDTMRGIYPLNVMREVYDVSRFGNASWKRRGLSARAVADAELITHIEHCFYEYDGIYGSPKIHHKLNSEGIKVSVNKATRLMHEQELKACCQDLSRSCHTRSFLCQL